MLKNGLLTVLSPKRRVESFRIDAESFAATPTQIVTGLMNEAIAYYQTTADTFKSGAVTLESLQATQPTKVESSHLSR